MAESKGGDSEKLYGKNGKTRRSSSEDEGKGDALIPAKRGLWRRKGRNLPKGGNLSSSYVCKSDQLGKKTEGVT